MTEKDQRIAELEAALGALVDAAEFNHGSSQEGRCCLAGEFVDTTACPLCRARDVLAGGTAALGAALAKAREEGAEAMKQAAAGVVREAFFDLNEKNEHPRAVILATIDALPGDPS